MRMFWLCKAAIPHMEPGSTIINTASVQGFDPSPHLLDYATTKAGIVNFTKGLGAQLAEKGIRVNGVAPGPVWTPLIPATMDEEKVADVRRAVAAGPGGAAGRARADLRLPGLAGVELHHRRGHRRDRRLADRLTDRAPTGQRYWPVGPPSPGTRAAGLAGRSRVPGVVGVRRVPGRERAHLLQLRLRRHLLGEQRGLDAVEEPLEPAHQLGLGDPQLGVGRVPRPGTAA